MKKKIIYYLIVLSAVILQSCDIYDTNSVEVDYTPPNPPAGVQVLNGDSRVDIFWAQNREPDLAGYNIFTAIHTMESTFLSVHPAQTVLSITMQ